MTEADIANGKRFAEQHGVRFNKDRKPMHSGWLVWDGNRWCEKTKTDIEALAKQTAISLWGEAKAANSDKLTAWAMRSQMAAGIHGMLAFIRRESVRGETL